MNLLLLMSLQAAASPAPPPAADPGMRAIRFDLAKVRRSGQPAGIHDLFVCDRSGGDLVVCGHRAGPRYPIEEMAGIFEAKPLRAEMRLGSGATGDVHV